MKRIEMLFVGIVLMLAGHISASACVFDLPLKPIPIRTAVAQAKTKAVAVFSGEVIQLDDFSVKFKVERIWKGDAAENIVMRTGAGTGENGGLIVSTCAYPFTLGEK
jgi:hypothetical protein